MDRKPHLLETFVARADQGSSYKVFGDEHLVRAPASPEFLQQWEPMRVAEYKLADGKHVDLEQDGTLRVAATGLQLKRQ